VYSKIPAELKALRQWIVYKVEIDETGKVTKMPYNPHNGYKASPTNPVHWGSFEEAVAVSQYCSGIGFVISPSDPYLCIDLDDAPDEATRQKQQGIFAAFESYSEISPSGLGCHIWIRAKVPTNRNRAKVEMYTAGHYMTFTGNCCRDLPIKDYQELADLLWSEMEAKPQNEIGPRLDTPEVFTDYEILSQASSASNGTKFIDIFEGRWQQYFPEEAHKEESCNQADQALVNLISFYTQNREQIKRIFRSSVIGQRKKAQREDYFEHPEWGMLDKSFDKMHPPLNLDALHANLQLQLAAVKAESVQPVQLSPLPPVIPVDAPVQPQQPAAVKKHKYSHISKDSNIQNFEYSLPPGLCGDIAQFIYAAAPRPVKEIAIAGALGLMSGVCGRAYNVSGTGLNTYTFLIAKTGRGKEAMRRCINKLLGATVKSVEKAHTFMGPAKIASPEALMKYISKSSQSFVSIMGEFADTLKKMSNDSRNPVQQGVRIAMLDLYNQSGHDDVLGSLIYSDKDKNTAVTRAPAFSVLGEATPEKFYELLSKDMINEGLLPRCTIIEYKGDRVPTNDNHHNATPSQQLTDRFSALCAYALQLNNGDNVINVGTDEAAQKLFKEFDVWCDHKVNTGDSVSAELWTRAHMKVLKLAALLAVGVNCIQPVINVECATWALQLITQDVLNLLGRFESGEIGVNNVQNDQATDIKKVIKKYVSGSWDDVKKYAGCSEILFQLKIIPHSYITACCRQRASFKNDRLGPVPAIGIAIKSLADCGEIVELSPLDKKSKNLTDRAKLYVISGMQL
jgi:hypothetical protein